MTDSEWLAGTTNRAPAETLKISTPFGSMFIALSTGPDGEFVITQPQKLEETTVGQLLDALADGVTRLLRSNT